MVLTQTSIPEVDLRASLDILEQSLRFRLLCNTSVREDFSRWRILS